MKWYLHHMPWKTYVNISQILGCHYGLCISEEKKKENIVATQEKIHGEV